MVGHHPSPPRRVPLGRLPVAEIGVAAGRLFRIVDEGPPANRDFRRTSHSDHTTPVRRDPAGTAPRRPAPIDQRSAIMTDEQQNAQHALQEAMDRRDNGGETGH